MTAEDVVHIHNRVCAGGGGGGAEAGAVVGLEGAHGEPTKTATSPTIALIGIVRERARWHGSKSDGNALTERG